jgi:LysM repeat protein
MRFYVNIFVVIFLFAGKDGSAQTVSSVKYRKGTQYYYIHTIAKNETLGQIASVYRVTVKEIMEVNSTLADPEKISEGQTINIPDFSGFIDKYPRERWNFVLYRVQKGDKLKSIAKDFQTDPDDIKNINPKIENKPVTGSEIRIPVPKQFAQYKIDRAKKDKKDSESEEYDNSKIDDRSNPALSFNWSRFKNNDERSSEDAPRTELYNDNCKTYNYRPGTVFTVSIVVPTKKADKTIDRNAVAFLQGAMIALGDMKETGLSVRFNTFDLSQAGGIDRVLRSHELAESDIILSPFGTGSELSKLAAFARDKRIKLVIQGEGGSRSLVSGNPCVIRLYPSEMAIRHKLADKQYDDDVFPVLIKPEKPDSLALATFRAALKRRFGSFAEHTHVKGLSLNRLHFKDVLHESKHNLIFVCSDAEPFVSDLVIRLNTLKNRISVYGSDKWNDFKLINRPVFFDINLHVAQPFFVDYKKDNAKQFVRLFRAAYNNEPDKYAFMGYDVTYYFMATLRRYGSDFQGCFTDFHSTLLQSRYKFRQNAPGDGFVNEGCFLLEYAHDIEIKRE